LSKCPEHLIKCVDQPNVPPDTALCPFFILQARNCVIYFIFLIINLSVDEIGERYRLIPTTTLTMPSLQNFTTLIINFPVIVHLSRQRIVTFVLHRDFWLYAPYKYSYLLTYCSCEIHPVIT